MLTLPLRGPAGEPVDFARTINSHGVASLPPITPDGDPATSLRATLRLPDGRIEHVRIASPDPATLTVETPSDLDPAAADALAAAVRHILRLDADLSPFYAKVLGGPDGGDPDLAWVAAGAGRLMRCQTVFEDVVKTVCTTNCTWAGTVRMVEGLVRHLGELAHDAPADAPDDLPYRAFPTPAAMAEADPRLYKDLARCGYRGPYLQTLARQVAAGDLDLEAWGAASPDDLPDDELEKRLLALPGVGPYAAAHVLTMLGRYSRLVLDSWTRPTYAELVGRDAVPDAEIRERFARYGEHAGLAFWLTVTRPWLAAPLLPPVPPGVPEQP